MRKLRFISPVPLEVLGAVRTQGDLLEVEDEVATDLLRHTERFEEVDPED